VCAVTAAEADPGRDAGEPVEDRDERLGLEDRRDRLDREQVGTGLEELLDPGLVEVDQLPHGQPVPPHVLGAVGQHRAVRTYRRGHDPLVAGCVGGLPRQLHAPPHQAGRALAAQAALGEALERRLVAGRDRDVGTGCEVVRVHGADQIRILEEDARRPQRVAQVGAAPLELRRESAVQHKRTLEAIVDPHPPKLLGSGRSGGPGPVLGMRAT
jgi:hypothetical protein